VAQCQHQRDHSVAVVALGFEPTRTVTRPTGASGTQSRSRGIEHARPAWHAATLSLRYDESGERPDTAAGWIDPPRPVILNFTVSRTERALLHMWVREPDGWHGWVSYLERDPSSAG
jgi:hypothetical protein